MEAFLKECPRLMHRQDFFKYLAKEGWYESDVVADVVVFYFVFMPLLRHEIAEFCHDWNSHRIRAQSDRANSIGGIPNRLFSSPPAGVEQCGKSPNLEKVNEMMEQFDLFGKVKIPHLVYNVENANAYYR